MKEFTEPIKSELPLAKAFNRIISELNLLRIMSNPRVFSDSTDEMAAFRMQNYFLTILWEKWLHGDEQLKYHTVLYDLYHDCVDIVQDTKPEDLYPMITSLKAKSRFSVVDVLQNATGQQVTCYILDKEGCCRPMTFAEKELIKVDGMVKAMDLGHLVYTIAQLMESLTKEVESIAKSDRTFNDNHELLNALMKDDSSILHLQLEKTRLVQREQKTIIKN